MGRKHCGKRRNCSVKAISPFPTVFSKDVSYRHVKTRPCLGKGKLCQMCFLFVPQLLTLYQITNFQSGPNSKHLQATNRCNLTTEIPFGKVRKHCGKRRKCWLPAFSPFPTLFSNASFPGSLKVEIVWERVNSLPHTSEL